MSSMPWVDELQIQLKYAREERDSYKAERDALQAELNKAHQNAAFYRCCALSGEVPEDDAEPYPNLEGEG